MTMEALFEKFLLLEKSAGLFGMEIGGVPYWHLVRHRIFYGCLLPKFIRISDLHPDIAASGKKHGIAKLVSRLKIWTANLRSFLFENPDLSIRRRRLLFSLEPRATRLPDGRTVALMLEFFWRKLSSSAAVMVLSRDSASRSVMSGRRVFSPSAAFWRKHTVKRSRGYRMGRVDRGHAAAGLAEMFSKEFGRDFTAGEFLTVLDDVILRYKSEYPVFKRWLRRLGTEKAVVSVHYNLSNMILAKAAHSLGLQVVELQHGTVLRSHPAYNLPPNDSPYSADVLLTWGEFWSCQLRNYPLAGTVETGYPYLEYHLGVCPRVHGRDRVEILFISQGAIGGELSKIAVELRSLLAHGKFRIRYKLHPGESRTWRDLYPWLKDCGVEVVENGSENIYSCFASADVPVGVYSTALVEGFVWGLETYVFGNIPGGGAMAPFCGDGFARFVSSAAELAGMITDRKDERGHLSAGDVSRYWKNSAADNIAAALEN